MIFYHKFTALKWYFGMKIRVVKTASKAKAVQIVRYKNNKRVILQHIGSAHSETELDELLIIAEEWMKNFSKQLSIFPDESPNKLIHLNHCTFIGVQYNFFYQQINVIQDKMGFAELPRLLNDLVTMRIFEPTSKLRSLELMNKGRNINKKVLRRIKKSSRWANPKSNDSKNGHHKGRKNTENGPMGR